MKSKFLKDNKVAIIPARGGSKGIVRKNLLEFRGKSLLARCVETALRSEVFTDVYVSTDDSDIAEIAMRTGAQVIDRPECLATDTSSSEEAIIHALEFHKQKKGGYPELTCFLQCTSPFTITDDIKAALNKIEFDHCDSVFLASASHAFIWKETEPKGAWIGVNHDFRERLRRQDRVKEYKEAGNLYFFRTEGFLRITHRFFGKVGLVEIPNRRTFEIDSMEDFTICDAMAEKFDTHKTGAHIPTEIDAIVFDFDGTLTDDAVYLNQNGEEMVKCSRSDGFGIDLLKSRGLRMLILSRESNQVVSARAEKLNMEVIQGSSNKIDDLKEWCRKHHVRKTNLLYMGNDLNDLECLEYAQCGIVPCNAQVDAKFKADIVLTRRGGDGAVRELCEIIINHMER